MTIAVNNLKSIVMIWIMTCWYHNTTCKSTCSCYIWYPRSRYYSHKIYISTTCSNSCTKCTLKHVTGASCILTYYYLLFFSGILLIIVTKKSSHFIGMNNIQRYIRFTTKTISSEIFHSTPPILLNYHYTNILFFLFQS